VIQISSLSRKLTLVNTESVSYQVDRVTKDSPIF